MEDHGHRASILVSNNNRNGYARSGKVMLTSIIVVFSLIIIIGCFHSYANRSRRRHHLRRTRHRRHISTTADINNNSNSKTSDALDFSVLKSLPTFLYTTTHHGPPLECAVCLSEFELNESGRVLPNCKHCFHSQCIDTWFESQSTCPLCRAPVKPVEFTALSIDDEAAGSDETVDRRLCRPGRMRSSASTPALGACLGLEKGAGGILGICIEEVPSSMDSGCSRSPKDDVLSLKRIWSF